MALVFHRKPLEWRCPPLDQFPGDINNVIKIGTVCSQNAVFVPFWHIKRPFVFVKRYGYCHSPIVVGKHPQRFPAVYLIDKIIINFWHSMDIIKPLRHPLTGPSMNSPNKNQHQFLIFKTHSNKTPKINATSAQHNIKSHGQPQSPSFLLNTNQSHPSNKPPPHIYSTIIY